VPGNGTNPVHPGTVELLVVPAVVDRLLNNDLAALELETILRQKIVAHLDRYRLLTTNLIVREPYYRGVRVSAQIAIPPYSVPDVVKARVLERLQCFICPLSMGIMDEELAQIIQASWDGWPFGRNLYLAEIYSLIQQTPGVKHVLDVRLYERPVIPNQEIESTSSALPQDGKTRPEQTLKLVEGKLIKIPPDTLLCSLNHEVEIVEL
jgi:hypothetical protein